MRQGPVLPANNLDRFLGEQDFATARGMWLCSELTHARYILCCFNEVVEQGCQCKGGLDASPLLHCELSDMNFESYE